MKRLDHILQLDVFYKYAIALIICIVGFYHIEAFFVLFVYVIYVRKQLCLAFLGFLILVLFLLFLRLKDHDVIDVNDQYMVVDIDYYEYYDRYTIKSGRYKYHIYGNENTYTIGDVIHVKGKYQPYQNQRTKYGFNQKDYYLSFHIQGQIDVEEVSYIKHQFHLYVYRNQSLLKAKELIESPYILAFIFGERIYDQETTHIYQNFNILYMFTVSGMHVYFLIIILKKIMFIMNIRTNFQHVFIIILLSYVCYLNQFSYSVLRLLIIYFLRIINKKYALSMAHLDLICLTFLVLLYIHIGYIYHQGFMMTFVILVSLELFHPFTEKHHGYIKRLLMSIIISFAIIPFYPNIYILQILLLPFLITCITTCLYPLAILSMVSIRFNELFAITIQVFEQIIHFISQYQIYHHLPKFGFIASIFYYGLIIWMCFSKNSITVVKRFIIFIAVMFLIIMVQLKPYQETITFLDVGQGDTAIIHTNSCSAVIDSYHGTTDYLKHQGIYHLDYLILTHSHDDHIKEALDILTYIKVDYIVLSLYDKNYPLFNQQPLLVSAQQQLMCGNLLFDILGPIRNYNDENNHSIVLKFTFDNTSFLFTGDIEKEAEMDLMNTYKEQLKSDVIKVPHHGSNTSSTEAFLTYVNPSYAIFSLKTPNRYGFPSSEVLNRYIKNHVIIYRTDQHGTIIYDAKRRKEKWHVHLSI